MKKKTYLKLYLLATVCIFSCVLGKSLDVHADEYQYDDNGRITSVKHDDGSVTEYEYDKNGNIISIKTDVVKKETTGGEDKPTGEEDKPTGGDNKPTGEDKPTGGDNKPSGEEKKPTDDQTKDIVDSGKTGNENSDNNSKETDKGVKTGDETPLLLVGLLTLISINMIVLIIYKKRKNKLYIGEENED